MSDLPAAPYPADTLPSPRLSIDYRALERSDGWAISHSQGCRPYVLFMFFVAWQQTPCASLPGDDARIAALIECTPAYFAKHRRALMRDWFMAADGRYYSTILIPEVLEVIARRRRSYRKHLDAVLGRCGRACWYCGGEGLPLALDHVIPRIQGGSDDPDNLVPACKPCNSSKGGRTPEQWRSANGR